MVTPEEYKTYYAPIERQTLNAILYPGEPGRGTKYAPGRMVQVYEVAFPGEGVYYIAGGMVSRSPYVGRLAKAVDDGRLVPVTRDLAGEATPHVLPSGKIAYARGPGYGGLMVYAQNGGFGSSAGYGVPLGHPRSWIPEGHPVLALAARQAADDRQATRSNGRRLAAIARDGRRR